MHSTKLSEIEVKDDSIEKGFNMNDSAEKSFPRIDKNNWDELINLLI